MENFYENGYYRYNRALMLFAGVWPYQDTRQRRVRSLVFFFMYAVALFLQISKICTTKWDLDFISDVSVSFLPLICSFIIYCLMFSMNNQLKSYLDEIKEAWKSLETVEEHEILGRFAGESRQYTQLFLCAYYTFVVVIVLLCSWSIFIDYVTPLKKPSSGELPFPLECFCDQERYFYALMFLSYLVALMEGVGSAAGYAIFLVLIQHICGLFSIVKCILQEAFKDTDTYVSSYDEIYFKIIRSMKYHNKATKFLDDVNSSFGKTYLFQLGIIMFIICIDFLRIKNIMDELQNMLVSIVHISTICFWLFINCYLGQKIIDNSKGVFDNVCSVPWYTLPIKIQRLFVLMIMRSSKGSYMSIGKMFVASLELFASIIQTSMSYALVVYSVC